MPEGSGPALHHGPMGEESPQSSSSLSTGPHGLGSVELRPHCDTQPCVDGEGERPLSLVSTLSSGSSRDSHSLFESIAALPCSTTPPVPSEDDVDLELSPTQGAGEPSPPGAGSRGRWQERLKLRVIGGAGSRKSSGDVRHVLVAPVVTDAMAPNPKLTYVDRVVMEIIETERMYVKDLRSIVEDYLVHIIDLSSLPIQPEQVCALFGNIEDIYVFNSELLRTLDMCDNDPVAVAQCFVDKSEYFEIYTQYCTNYPNSVAALTDCMRSKTLAKFFRERQAALKRSLPLGSYLLKPVQRILKYHLLLQEIAKHFDPEEEGHEVVQEAIDTMTGVAWYINDMKRRHEHAVRVQEIQSLLINWKGPDLTTSGELVLEGTFHVLRAKNTRTLFLFEKMLLITKKRGEHYVYKSHISCSTLMLLDSAKDPLLFSVIHFKHPKQPHAVQAKSVEEKRLWAHHIKRLILENHNAVVPQKVRDVVAAEPNHPGKYQHSPERVTKAESCQAADFHRGARNERRRSEPAKQIVGSTTAVLKHAGSDGALLGDRPRSRSRDPVEPLARSSFPRDGEDDEDVELMEDDQDDGDTTELKTAPTDPEPDACRQEEQRVAVVKPQVRVEEMCPPDCGLQARKSDQLVGLHPDSPVQHQEPPELLDVSREEEELGSDSSGLQVETSVLTNAELSEEEEEEMLDDKSILPSSVLDQASVIAQRFISSLSRQDGVGSEDPPPPACPSPSADDQLPKRISSSAEPQTQEPSTSSDHVCPRPAPAAADARSTLSKRDRLLIHKIRTYYEHAEHQDANFSIKRRESLSYIPAGLVRHLSRQLNSIPQDRSVPVHRKGVSRNRPTSWSVFDLPGLEKTKATDSQQEPEPQIPMEARAASQSIAEDGFRPSSEMLEVWQDMETEEEEEEEDQTVQQKCNDSRLKTQDVGSDTSDGETTAPVPQVPSPATTSPASEGRSDQDSHTDPSSHDRNPFGHSQLPKVISFRTSVEEDQILQDMGKMKNKVFQLARQYSQRIKNNRPSIWQRSREMAKNLPALHEEKGKANPRLPSNTCHQAAVGDACSPSPDPTPGCESGSRSPVASPRSPQPDAFHWPDVQELRSKYTEPPHPKVTRSRTVPNGRLELATNAFNGRSLKYSSSWDLHKASWDGTRGRAPSVEDWPRPTSWAKQQPLLCRWSSLDHMLGSLPLNEVQNLQEHKKTSSTGGGPRHEATAAPTSGKVSESKLVKSLRDKFQGLST